MTQIGFFTHTLVVLGLCGTLAHELAAQEREASIGFSQIVSAGEGIRRTCFEPGSNRRISGRIAAPLRSRMLSVGLTAHVPVFSSPSTRVSGPLPPNITFVSNDRVNLLAAHYLATDVRAGMQFGPPVAVAKLSLGAGSAWRLGNDFPYLLAATQLAVRPTRWLQVALDGEYSRLRIVSNPVRFTYRGGQLVAREPLGRKHPWSHASSLGVLVGLRW